MTTLWMIEDLEPFPDAPKVGQVCEPTTYWGTPAAINLPAALTSTITARVEETTIDGRTESIAHLGDGFTTMLRPGFGRTGDVKFTGCLIWDRYLWLDYRTVPTGRALVTERALVIQRAIHTPTSYPGWYSVAHEGPKILHRGTVPDGHDIVAYALAVTLL